MKDIYIAFAGIVFSLVFFFWAWYVRKNEESLRNDQIFGWGIQKSFGVPDKYITKQIKFFPIWLIFLGLLSLIMVIMGLTGIIPIQLD